MPKDKGYTLIQGPTGRFASRGPNIQNITPKTEEGQKIRNAFLEQRCSYEINYFEGIWPIAAFTIGPLDHCVGFWDNLGWTIGMDGIDEHVETK